MSVPSLICKGPLWLQRFTPTKQPPNLIEHQGQLIKQVESVAPACLERKTAVCRFKKEEEEAAHLLSSFVSCFG